MGDLSYGRGTALLWEEAAPMSRGDLLAAFCRASIVDPGDWCNGICRMAASACHADAAGLVLGATWEQRGCSTADARLSARSLELLVDRVKVSPKCSIWQDHENGLSYAAVAIDGSAEAGLLWVRRRAAAFVWTDALNLRVVSMLATLFNGLQRETDQAELLRAEALHRCHNDLQLIGSLLSFQARNTADPEVRAALDDARGRIAALIEARRVPSANLTTALEQLVSAFADTCRARGITLRLDLPQDPPQLDATRLAAILLALNELLTNAVKHGFVDNEVGSIDVGADFGGGVARIHIADDGRRLPDAQTLIRAGSGLDLISRLLAGVHGKLFLPTGWRKNFTVEVPF